MTRALLVLAVLAASPAAGAYSINLTGSGFVIRWKSDTIGVRIHPAGSQDISNGSDLQALQSALSDWNAEACSAMSFVDEGPAGSQQVVSNGAEPNGLNELVWVEDATWEFGSHTLGVTSPIVLVNGAIIEADVAFNGLQVQWSTTGQFGRADVKSVAIHELGHVLGLQHVLGGYPASDPPTMAPTVDPYGKTASLTADDRLGICFLYPAAQTFSCTGDAQCPFVVDTDPDTGQESYSDKLNCDSGLCSFGPSGGGGSQIIGEACATQADCESPWFCQPLGNGQSLCTQTCTPEFEDCPTGFVCAPYQDGNGGACLPGDTPKKDDGETCSSHAECANGLCYPASDGLFYCRSGCDSDVECAQGSACFSAPGYATGACLPESLVPQVKVVDGDPCNEDGDCASGICRANPGTTGPRFCRSGCDARGQCSPGYDCLTGGTAGACVPAPEPRPRAAEGEACQDASECETDVCFGGVCRWSCNVVAPACAAGAGCQRTTTDGVAGVCLSRGPIEAGAPCNADPDCATLYCVRPEGFGGLRCAAPCARGAGGCGDVGPCGAADGLEVLGACPLPGDAPIEGGTSGGEAGGGADGGDGATQTPAPIPSGRPPATSGCSAASAPPSSPWPWTIAGGLLLLIAVRRNTRERT